MAQKGNSYIVKLSKSHLEWGTHRYTGIPYESMDANIEE